MQMQSVQIKADFETDAQYIFCVIQGKKTYIE